MQRRLAAVPTRGFTRQSTAVGVCDHGARFVVPRVNPRPRGTIDVNPDDRPRFASDV